MINARILGHDGQTLIKEMAIDRNYPELKVALPQKVELYRLEDPSPIADAPKIGLAYYERTDGGGTRIYRLKVNL